MNAMLQPIEIVRVEDGLPTTTTLQIALGLGIQHSTVIKLVRSYMPDFQEFGLVRFKIQPRSQGVHGGSDTKFVTLNEQQATFLMTLMRNSPKVIEFKKALVRAFFETREFIRAQDQSYNKVHNKLSLQLSLEKADASLAGHILGSYRKKRDLLVTALTEVEQLMQPCLFE
ncbi:Rha family transcriptional regulator [Acinetobacter gerneri]|jgi:phage regulator Rha-like protein|uniref:Rha family transcriptional regulator n=1 Tax=Acinetobacter gerneri TaxID=202952 RepID=UPI0023F52ADB|nr:Rha family transcriptional regulator [Acinetobacter gerneri]MCH4243759.1 Rha family transcriptional regulator [Acinetobacter gerneri]